MKKTAKNHKKLNVAILGSGNIGSDLLMKVLRSSWLECSMFIGQNPESENLYRVQKLGIATRSNSIQAIKDEPDSVDIVFDATSVSSHRMHAPLLEKLQIFTIDMTPSKIGHMCVPSINLEESITMKNVNMISCGGQAATPLIKTLLEIHPEIRYVEVVSSISSISAGIGTRNNIDEYTQTTSEAIMALTGATQAKTIIILNPAVPPIHMHNTIYVEIERADLERIKLEIYKTVQRIKTYVPGYTLTMEPTWNNGRLTMMTEVIGMGDFLPTYAGNLDIINHAAIAVAEAYAKKVLH